MPILLTNSKIYDWLIGFLIGTIITFLVGLSFVFLLKSNMGPNMGLGAIIVLALAGLVIATVYLVMAVLVLKRYKYIGWGMIWFVILSVLLKIIANPLF